MPNLVFQTDTLTSDSITISSASPKETIPDSVSPSIEKKDTLITSKPEKKTAVKIIKPESLPIKNADEISTDTFPQTKIDSVFASDSISFFQEEKPAPATANLQSEIPEKNFFQFKTKKEQHSDWVLLLFIFVFSLLAWVKVSYSKRLKQMFAAFINNRYVRQLVREEFVFTHPLSIVLTVVFLINFSLLIAQANNYFGWNIFEGGFMLIFFKLFFSLSVFYLLKIFLIRLSGILFSVGKEITEYLFHLFLFNNILGLLLLPVAMGVFYADAFSPDAIIFLSGALILAAFLFRIGKSIFIGITATKISASYIILYICTLEILPLFVVIKAFSQ